MSGFKNQHESTQMLNVKRSELQCSGPISDLPLLTWWPEELASLHESKLWFNLTLPLSVEQRFGGVRDGYWLTESLKHDGKGLSKGIAY